MKKTSYYRIEDGHCPACGKEIAPGFYPLAQLMEVEEEIKFWERMTDETKNKNLMLVTWGIAAGLKLAKAKEKIITEE
jgi:hypothetical protein